MVSEIHNMGPCLLKLRTVIFNIQKDHSVPWNFKKEVYIIYVDKSIYMKSFHCILKTI